MSVSGTHTPFAGQTPQRQDNTDMNLGGQSRKDGDRPDTGARQESFGRAMAKAMAPQRKPLVDDAAPIAVPVAVPVLSPLIPQPPVQAEPAAAMRGDATAIADRIDRYLRGADGASSLRQGDGMVVRLPGNALGVTQVALRLEGEVLVVSLSMQAQAGAAAMAVLGQAIQSRSRHAVRLEDDTADAARPEDDTRFDPLNPRGPVA